MKKCTQHSVELKGPNGAGKYWHLVNYATKEYCNYTQAEYDALASETPAAKTEPEVDPKVWAEKDRQSLAQTAMKGACEISAAMINAGIITGDAVSIVAEVKAQANELYKELKLLKVQV